MEQPDEELTTELQDQSYHPFVGKVSKPKNRIKTIINKTKSDYLLIFLFISIIIIVAYINNTKSSELAKIQDEKIQLQNKLGNLEASIHDNTDKYNQIVNEKKALEKTKIDVENDNTLIEKENDLYKSENDNSLQIVNNVLIKKNEIAANIKNEENKLDENKLKVGTLIETLDNLVTEIIRKAPKRFDERPRQ